MAKPTAQMYDVSFLKKGDSESSRAENHWVKLGRAFFDEKTGRIQVKLDTLPVRAWDGRVTLFPIQPESRTRRIKDKPPNQFSDEPEFLKIGG